MNFSLRIALRYFFSKKKRNIVNIISFVSVLGVAVGTMALVVVLSAFNGLDGLVRDLFGTFDSELRIIPREGKSFEVDDKFLLSIQAVEGVNIVSEVIEDNALLKYRDKQSVIKIKGVDEKFFKQNDMTSAIKEGSSKLKDKGKNFLLLGMGIQYKLAIPFAEDFNPVVIWYPKNEEKVSLNPEKAFNRLPILLGGLFTIERQYDDVYAFAPLDYVEELTEFKGRRTSIELSTKPNAETDAVKASLEILLGDKFLVQNSDEQHASLYKAHKVEKLFTFLIFSFILLIVSLNIFFSLSMLVMEKKKDIAILNSFGVSRALVRRIFLTNGFLLALTGTLLGLFLGFGICFLQQSYGFVSMGMQTAIVDAYPIIMKPLDFLLTAIVMLFIAYVVSFFPASAATKVVINEEL